MAETSLPVVMFGVNPEPRSGGEVYHSRVLQYLRETGANVINLPLPDDRSSLPLPIRLILANFSILWQFLRLKTGPCVLFEDCYLHARFLLTNLWAHQSGSKIVMLMQFSISDDHRLLRHALWRRIDHAILGWFLRGGDVVVANSVQSARDVISVGCAPDKIKVIYCGSDFQIDHQSANRSYELADGRLNILNVGSVIERKGLRYLVQALATLPRSFHLDVVGDTEDEPEYVAELRGLATDLGVSGQITFHGYSKDVTELGQFYRSADVFVLPSLHETFGIVLLEAMSFGLPIVTTTAGALPELVKHNRNGLLTPPGDAVALSRALMEVTDSTELRRRLGQNGYSFMRESRAFYSWKAVGARLVQALPQPAKGKAFRIEPQPDRWV